MNPQECVNTVPPDTTIHEQMTMINGYVRVYDDKHILSNGETTLDNYVNDATHVDAHEMQT